MFGRCSSDSSLPWCIFGMHCPRLSQATHLAWWKRRWPVGSCALWQLNASRNVLTPDSAPPQMFCAEVVVAALLGKYYGTSAHASDKLPHSIAILVIVFICIFIASFAWSWGPLGWLVPS